MTSKYTRPIALLFLSAVLNAGGSVLYVDLGSPKPMPPYTNWATAALTIQDAVDVAAVGDQILVTDGTYAAGGRAAGTNSSFNRVVVDKALALLSVNGPSVTRIEGMQPPGTTNESSAIRCVYLADGALLAGFTVTNGAAGAAGSPSPLDRAGGGVLCASSSAVISNCVLAGNSATLGGGAYLGTLVDCLLKGNSASTGGGACKSVLNNCVLAGNSAKVGGGAYESTLHSCVLTNNTSSITSGGAEHSALTNCTLSHNSATSAGGAALSTLDNCALISNVASNTAGGVFLGVLNRCLLKSNVATLGGGAASATLVGCMVVSNYGGGAWSSVLDNCTLHGNSTSGRGGGAAQSSLTNCTVTANSAYGGGGTHLCTAVNCIIYYNTTFGFWENYDASVEMNNCCTTPLPPSGFDNITDQPLFVDLAGGNLHLQPTSPCINAGRNSYITTDSDLDGNPRLVGGTVDIGAYEFQEPTSRISYAWLQKRQFPLDGSSDNTDSDGDGLTNLQEWLSGTEPMDAEAGLRLLPPVVDTVGITIRWEGVTNRTYTVERSANLREPPSFVPIATNLQGRSNIIRFTDTNASAVGPLFYRVRTAR